MHAVERILFVLRYAEYLGGAVTCDAHHMTDPRADGLGVSTCINLALKDAGVEREQINYINAHATRWGCMQPPAVRAPPVRGCLSACTWLCRGRANRLNFGALATCGLLVM